MIFPDFQQFTELAKQGNFVPVYQEWVADLDTPVSAWYKVCAESSYSFLLESVEGGEKVGRYSLLGCDPLWILEARGNETIQKHRDGSQQVFTGNPFNVLADCLAPYQPVQLPQLPSGIGGLFGFWGYELINWIESRVSIHPQDDRNIPDGLWMQVDHLLIFDQVKRKIWALAYADLRNSENLQAAYQKACDRIQEMVGKLSLPLSLENTQLPWTSPQNQPKVGIEEYSSNFTQTEFCNSVEKA
ncbi:MAG: anthranilate synthase component I, partial [Sphaerospermopsis sp. SIO1G2]|nr:anthranilate synthase component I [Sphaerospermopsis sp. SIO1G2]